MHRAFVEAQENLLSNLTTFFKQKKKKEKKKKNNGLLGTVLKDQVNTIINQTLLPHFNRTLSSNKIQELPEAVFANLNSLVEL